MIWVQGVFWGSVLALMHTYVFYPLYVLLKARSVREPSRNDATPTVPTVTVLIAAYNAGKHIQQRIENLLACNYPADRWTIVIASDGSTDATVAQARSFASDRVTVLDFPERRGKAATLIRAMASIDTDVVLFTDATSHFEPDAIHHLAKHFRDPSVGVASGQVRMLTDAGLSAEGFYWKLESAVRCAEAKLGILTGVSGAIYAIRRSMFVTPDRPTVNDDMIFPILAQQRHGCRFVLDLEARAEVIVPRGLQNEFRRRRRIGAGAFHSLTLLWPAIIASNKQTAFALISHKLLRWSGPLLLLIALVTNLCLIGATTYAITFAMQVLLMIAAVVGYRYPATTGALRLCTIATSFYIMNLALATGFIDWILARQSMSWEPTPRPERADVLTGQLNALP